MIINNIGINFAGGGGGTPAPSKVIGTKDFGITANGTTNITMDQGVDGISAGTISVDVQPVLTSATITENGTYTPDEGIDGYSAVTVDTPADRLPLLLQDQITALTASDFGTITGVRDYQFYGLSRLKSVELSENVKILYQHCFDRSGIETIDVSNVTTYGTNVFQNCTALTNVIGFEGYTGAPLSNLFSDCTALTSVTTSMYSSAYTAYSRIFSGCKSLKSVTWLTNQVQVSYNSAYSNIYQGCTSMEYIDYTHNYTVPSLLFVNPFTAFTANYEIRVPQSLYNDWTAATNWSNSAIVGHIVGYPDVYNTVSFQYTTSDGNEITPNNPYSSSTSWSGTFISKEFDASTGGTVSMYGPIKIVGFDNKTNLQTFTALEGVTGIGYAAFYQDTGLVSISLPNSLTMIEAQAFWGCSSLTGITIPDGVYYGGETTINYRTFSGCTGLQEIVLGDGILTVPYNSTNWVTELLRVSPALTAVTFGSKMGDVSLNFNSNASVSDITFKGLTIPTNIGNGTGIASTGTMHVPVTKVAEYEAFCAMYSYFSGWTVTGDVVVPATAYFDAGITGEEYATAVTISHEAADLLIAMYIGTCGKVTLGSDTYYGDALITYHVGTNNTASTKTTNLTFSAYTNAEDTEPAYTFSLSITQDGNPDAVRWGEVLTFTTTEADEEERVLNSLAEYQNYVQATYLNDASTNYEDSAITLTGLTYTFAEPGEHKIKLVMANSRTWASQPIHHTAVTMTEIAYGSFDEVNSSNIYYIQGANQLQSQPELQAVRIGPGCGKLYANIFAVGARRYWNKFIVEGDTGPAVAGTFSMLIKNLTGTIEAEEGADVSKLQTALGSNWTVVRV